MINWYPWYPADFRIDTAHLTAEQDGIYRRLIDYYNPNNGLQVSNCAMCARLNRVELVCGERCDDMEESVDSGAVSWQVEGRKFLDVANDGFSHIPCIK